ELPLLLNCTFSMRHAADGNIRSIPRLPIPRIVPFFTVTLLRPAITPSPAPVGLQLATGFPEHTVGPLIAKPLRSRVTASASISIAPVPTLGTVRLPERR